MSGQDSISCLDAMDEWLKQLLALTAWPMEPPPLFGTFHLSAFILSLLIPILLARFMKSRIRNTEAHLFHLGVFLACMELYKQLFLYLAVNDMHYNFWYFPFQLCSMPMYICLALPLLGGRAKETAYTFLFDFTLPGALLALIFPADMMRPYVTMTAHAFLWHAVLIYISLTVFHAGLLKKDRKSFFSAAALYLVLAFAAFVLNLLLDPLAEYGSRPGLFYLSPYYVTDQPVFHDIALRFGIPAELVIYVLSFLLFAYLFHVITRALLFPEKTEHA